MLIKLKHCFGDHQETKKNLRFDRFTRGLQRSGIGEYSIFEEFLKTFELSLEDVV